MSAVNPWSRRDFLRTTGTAGGALVLVGFRTLVKPEPAEFLSRQAGLYLALAAAGAAVIAGLAQVSSGGRAP